MRLVEQHLIRKIDSRYAAFDRAAFASNNLYNQANYQIRQAYILSFTSGMFVPLINLPSFVQVIAPYLPTYHLAQLAWRTVNAVIDKQTVWDSQPMWVHFLWLAGYGIIFLLGAVWAYNRDEARRFA